MNLVTFERIRAKYLKRLSRYDDEDTEWITLSPSGTHVPLKDGVAVGGPFKGQEFNDAKGSGASSSSSHVNNKGVKNSSESIKSELSKFDSAPLAKSPEEADDKYRAWLGENWKKWADEDTKNYTSKTGSIIGYTEDSTKINAALRGLSNGPLPYLVKMQINDITSLMKESKLPEDSTFLRGLSTKGAADFMGIDVDTLVKSPDRLVGLERTEDAFASCSTAYIEEGYGKSEVQFEIFAPKGTEAIYAEPFSAHGGPNGKRRMNERFWDGESKQTGFGKECEMILQRGTSFQIVGAEKDPVSGKVKIKMTITGQNYKEPFEGNNAKGAGAQAFNPYAD